MGVDVRNYELDSNLDGRRYRRHLLDQSRDRRPDAGRQKGALGDGSIAGRFGNPLLR